MTQLLCIDIDKGIDLTETKMASDVQIPPCDTFK